MKKILTLFIVIINLLISQSLFAVDPRFHTYGETIDEMRYITLRYPNITRVYTIGYTTANQLPIIAMKISDNPQLKEDEPRLLFNGIHHPAELIGPEICLYLISDLVNKYNTDSFITSVINNSEIWIVPMVNPDGNYIVHAGFDTMWRKNTRDNNQNGYWDYSDGVNINRNYDFLWNSGGNMIPGDRDYRGPYPFSENETQAIRDLTLREKFIFDICYHSSRESGEGEAVYYPWLWTTPCPDYAHIKKIADSLAYSIINDAGNGTYYAIAGRASEGGLARNWLYYNGTISFTVEVSHGYFPHGYLVDSICQRNLSGVYYLLRRTFSSQITGYITDSITGLPLVAEVKVLGVYAPPETIAPRTSDSIFGRFYRILNPGTYTVKIEKSGYKTESIPDVIVPSSGPAYLSVKMKPSTNSDVNIIPASTLRNNFQVYSNITERTSKISFSLTRQTNVNINVYSEDGRIVRDLTNQIYQPGNYKLSWNYRGANNKKVADGIYFVKIITDSYEDTKKIIVVN